MATSRDAVGRFSLIAGIVILSASTGSGACFVDDIPACPGQCFDYTVQYPIPTQCLNDMGQGIDVPFNGNDSLATTVASASTLPRSRT